MLKEKSTAVLDTTLREDLFGDHTSCSTTMLSLGGDYQGCLASLVTPSILVTTPRPCFLPVPTYRSILPWDLTSSAETSTCTPGCTSMDCELIDAHLCPAMDPVNSLVHCRSRKHQALEIVPEGRQFEVNHTRLEIATELRACLLERFCCSLRVSSAPGCPMA